MLARHTCGDVLNSTRIGVHHKCPSGLQNSNVERGVVVVTSAVGDSVNRHIAEAASCSFQPFLPAREPVLPKSSLADLSQQDCPRVLQTNINPP
jgi:hypothetical protein